MTFLILILCVAVKQRKAEYNDAAIETLQLDRIDIGVETVLPVMVNAGTDSCFLEIMENAIDAETETSSELPSYLHRGTSPPPFASLDIPTDAILPFLAMNSDPMEFNALEANEESHFAIHSLGRIQS